MYSSLSDDKLNTVRNLLFFLKTLGICNNYFVDAHNYYDTVESMKLIEDKNVQVNTTWTSLNRINKIIILF